MGQIIPIRLQEVVSVREDAQNQIRMLDPARQHQLWSAVDGLVRAGFSTVKKFSEMHLEFVCRTGTLIYGAAKINQILMIFRLWKDKVSIINVIDLVQKTFASVLVRPIFHETNPNDGNFAVTMIETTGHGKFRFDMLWYGEYNGVPRPPAHRAITL